MLMEKITGKISKDSKALDSALRIEESFDLASKEIALGDRKAELYFVDAFAKDEVLEKIIEFLSGLTEKEIGKCADMRDFCSKYVTYSETDILSDIDDITVGVLSGTPALLVDGFAQAVMIDARTYPIRSMDEPDSDRVLFGSHDGFTETLVFNAALIRRRLRDPNLTLKTMKAGKKSRTDIMICYLENMADKKILSRIEKKISEINVNTLALSQQSLAECLSPKQWYNPFPKVRYTERPDTAVACIAEGNIIIMVDNSPVGMIVNTGFLDFIQDSNDYYFPPLIGTFLRYVRMVVFVLTMILTPIWYLLIKNPEWIPQWLDFIRIEEPVILPVIVQLLIIELIVDALKLASLNTPNSLSGSFSVVGALVLGEFAVNAKWFVAEVVLYMAFVAIANFAQPSFELGYAFKFSRILLLVLTAFFNLWGFIAGSVIILTLIATNKTVCGRSYLYPRIPFDKKALLSLLVRRNITKSKS